VGGVGERLVGDELWVEELVLGLRSLVAQELEAGRPAVILQLAVELLEAVLAEDPTAEVRSGVALEVRAALRVDDDVGVRATAQSQLRLVHLMVFVPG
jgi:hypothetical protein